MSTVTANPQFGTTPMAVRKFTVAEYHRMIETGILTENDEVELLEGWIVAKMPHSPRHDGALQRVNKRLGRRLPPGWDLRVQCPVTTGDSEPEPDIAVVRGDETSYDLKHPEPADIGALIEVSDSSLNYDRHEKGSIYARAGIASYWIVNLVDGWIEVYTDPDRAASSPTYQQRTNCGPSDAIPLNLDGQVIATILVAELLP